MEPEFVSGVEQFVNEVTLVLEIHGHYVRIDDYSLIVIRPLTSLEWFLKH